MNVTNNKVSLIFTSILTAINAIVLFTLKVKMVTALTVLLLLFGVLYVLFRVLLFLLVFKGLEQVWSNIRASRKGRSEHDPFDHTFNIKWIDDEVKLLLNEKSSEIVKLKEVEQFRKDFLGSVAHELRTPVFGIQGYIHTLIDGADENEAIRKRFLKKAAKNADSLTAILEDLITISRIETNQVKIEKTAFELIELIDEVYEGFELDAEPKGISLKRKGLDKAVVEADYQKIKQVFVNLVSNSIKYGKENGQTTVSVFDLKEQILIEVADNGVGIDKNDLPRIFERFYRVDKSRSRNEGSSTGLGLSIVKHFLEAHNQEIKVRSSQGKGTVFTFTLAKSSEKFKQLSLK